MINRNTIIILIVAYILGLGAAWEYYLKTKPTDEQLADLTVDAAIRDDLCTRIDQDLNKFKDYPHSFIRTSLNELVSESTATTKAFTSRQPDNKPVKFRGLNGKSVVSSCEEKARKWVEITTAFPDQYESELAIINNHKSLDQSQSIPRKPTSSSAIKSSGKRIALVIGNSAYNNHPLKNPANDAKDISAVLHKEDFKVLELYNADLDEMRRSINSFSEQLTSYDVALVYYSGHGIEFSGRNYFIPVNAQINSEDEIPRQGFDATEIVEKMSRSNIKTSIFIIDACRNAPIFSKFKGTESGLASMQGSTGTVLAFSAAPGHVALDGNGRNSPYTAALIDQMQIPNKKIEDVMKDTARIVSDNTAARQIPWYNSSLIGDFYFVKQ